MAEKTNKQPRALKRETADKAATVSIGLRVPASLRNRMQRLAETDGRTLNNWIVRQLETKVLK